MSAPSPLDHVLRAVTEDGSFRVIAVNATETVRGIVAAQRAQGAIVPILGDLVVATILLRELMSPELRVQGIMFGETERGRLVADAHPDGITRGLVQLPAGATFVPHHLQMMRTLRNGAIQQGVVAVPQHGDVAAGMMEYLQTSEQLVSTTALTTLVEGDHVRAAGGFVVQLLPEATRGPLAAMTDRLRAMPAIAHLLEQGQGPETLLRDILEGMPYARTAESNVRFGCTCSEGRLMASLATLPASELQSMVDDGEVLDVACEYCGKKYPISPEQLRGMLAKN